MTEPNSVRPWGMDTKAFCMLMHFSQFAGFIIPFGGFVLPLIMWLTNKEDVPEVDAHGKVIMNWILSALIYSVVCAILTLILIGLLGFAVLGLLGVVFTIVGGVKANNGELWTYPLSIKFFK